MSEPNSLSSNNLCTTEDAFEKFQAGASYAEEEFITLSDIVPPQPEVPDLCDELNEIPFDNEVVLTSDDANTPQKDGNIGTSSDLNNEINHQNIEKLINNDSGYQNEGNHEGKRKINKRQHRGGRKSKSGLSTTSYESSYVETENNSLLDNQTSQDVHSTTTDKNGSESINDSQEESKYPRRTRRERVPNTSKYPLIPESAYDTPSKNTKGKRRGRPKKSMLENTSISEPDSTNIDSTLSNSDSFCIENNEPESLKRTEVKRGRRGRPKPSQVDINQTISNDSSNIDESADTDIPLSELKKPTRRGRKKNCDMAAKPAGSNEANTEIPGDQAEENKFTETECKLPEQDVQKLSDGVNQSSDYDIDDMDIDDDICLSKIKKNINNITDTFTDSLEADMLRIHGENTETATCVNGDSEMPAIADFEETIDKIAKENNIDNVIPVNNTVDESLLVEDTSKRPNRRRAKKNFKYEVDSDEDPFANVELSEDEHPRRRKKTRYNDDDEYIPGKKKGMTPVSSSSDSDIDEDDEDGLNQKRKKVFSPKKKGRKKEIVEVPLESTPLTVEENENEPKPDDEPLSMKPPAEAWATSNAFENFIAQKIQGSNLKIKKVTAKQKTESTVVPLEIPVLKQEEPKKFVEMSSQTSKPSTCSTGMQTTVPYDIPMKVNAPLSTTQSYKACEFLNSVVKTTAELGQLMKDKSEDFMKKKINTDNVTDTFKMDYCVRKSFLLFKLAKHNLLQMEEDLSKQYDAFLKNNELSKCRDEIKNIAPKKPKPKADSDSDCEIVDVKEVPSTSAKQDQPKLNKTVFLNKELSIKIAKKQTADKNVEVKGRNTVWINDSVMVKKVKPTQSFLAQDSRNKKPPDHVTEKMVSDFFENYYLQRAVAVCAPFITTEWSCVRKEYACHYFVKSNLDDPDVNNSEVGQNIIQIDPTTPESNCTNIVEIQKTHTYNPKSLSSLCSEVVRSCLHVHNGIQANEDVTCDLTDGKSENRPLSLFRLCYQSLCCKLQSYMSSKPQTINNIEEKNISLTAKLVPPLPLKTLCYRKIAELMPSYENVKDKDTEWSEISYEDGFISENSNLSEDINDLTQNFELDINGKKVHMKSLFSLCVSAIQTIYRDQNISETTSHENFVDTNLIGQIESIYSETSSPKSLKYITYKNVQKLMFGDEFRGKKSLLEEPIICNSTEDVVHNPNSEDFTINCINTVSEEAFHGLDATNDFQDEDDYDYEPDIENYEEENNENEWISQVKMQVLQSCTTPIENLPDVQDDNLAIGENCDTLDLNPIENDFHNTSIVNNDEYTPHSTLDNIAIVPHIKQELQDEVDNVVDTSIVKTEPVHVLHAMTIIPESIVTKSELMEHNTGIENNTGIEPDPMPEAEISAYDVNTFKQFAMKNKMMRSMDHEDDDDSDDGEIFGGRRERREHEPDYDAGNDINESLLVPHTYEPLHVDNAKGDLMESSSDESSSKKVSKKKLEKKKGKQKKVKEVPKNSTTKEVPAKDPVTPVKDKVPTNEVAVLTRRMREKIRQEERKIESSDSETDNMALSLRKDKSKVKEKIESSDLETDNMALNLKKDKTKVKETETAKPTKNLKKAEPSSSKEVDNEIQCNNVDSTEPTIENVDKKVVEQFSGFSAIDQNEISSYQKFMKFVYDKIVPRENDQPLGDEPGINDEADEAADYRPNSPLISPDEPVELLECEPTMPIFDNVQKPEKRSKKPSTKKKENKIELEAVPKFTERSGWHIYPIDSTDMKLYQNCYIPLEKLPESFVDIYQEYQDITDRDNTDKEIDRLANLQTLNRSTSIKEGKTKSKLRGKSSCVSEQNSTEVSRVPSPAHSDRLDELTPSEDEGANVDDELPPPVPVRASENNIAKSSLMDEHESDSDSGTKKVKEEPKDNTEGEDRPSRPGPKSKTKLVKLVNLPPSESLMLTADKMMNKELNLLHAPVCMKEEPKEVTPKEPSPKDETKQKKRSSKTISFRDRLKTEDDSSSEEEKQWVSTKEKLLKRVGKKEDAVADDAKRAKIVDDFIERRGEGHESRRTTRGSRRSRKKKALERMKQQRVLSNELYGEPSQDLTSGGKRGAPVGLFKGRRNIRKVIDKKSLQKSTVLANMEEFERKRRLHAKQNQLRELLGCEEGVNVLVINDEVCLEYDFEQQRPVVTVHPFFTKVMKAHQYEGVKFMWDACFESLAGIESGRGGGGCILAHCMGLGKTLQVLALLHTVLTHPRAGMHRVLVCCPLSTVLNWVDEIHKWLGPVTDQIKVFELSKLKKTYERAYQLEDWYSGGGIFIIGYELFRSLTTLDPSIDEVRPTIIKKIRTALLDPGPDIIVCDEGHLLKNDCSVLAVAMSRVVTKRRIVLTGTPMQNNLREYFCMVNFIKPNLLGTYSEYSNRFENPIMNGQHRDSREEDIKLMKARTHILHKVLEGCLQRQEASVLYPYLPKKHEYTVFIPLTKCQWDLYKHYVHHYTMKSKQSVLRDFHILQKIWSHPLVLHNFQTRDHAKKKEIKPEKIEDDLALEDKEDIKPPDTETWWLQYLADGAMLNSIDSSNKFVAVFRILHECIALGDKVLIFSTSLDCLDALESFLRQINGWNLGQEYYRLDGSVPAEVRQKWVREYNAENNHKTKLFLISTRAGCLGLNMTAANRVIILDTSWNPAHDIQSIFRVYRFGQKKDCYIYRLVAMGTMEQKIYERSVMKQAVACRVVDEQQIDRHYNSADLTELYKFDEQGVGVAGGVAVGVADVVLLRVARDAAIHAVHEHDSLLRGSGEQGLPEHERAAAWMQFQQEHAHKQMQNDLESDIAARALKKLQDEQRIQEQQRIEAERQLLEKQQAQVHIKTEEGPVHNLLVPREIQPPMRGRGGYSRGRGRKVVQCNIPIIPNTEQPSTSRQAVSEESLVQQISDILIKYNFTQTKGPQQVKELVARVKKMIQSGKTMEGCDELTASIAQVLLQKHDSKPAPVMPALTNIECEPRRRGRPRKDTLTPRVESPPPPPRDKKPETGGRLRRLAAIQAEQQFDMNDDCASQDSTHNNQVIDLDDGDWQAANSDTDSAPENITDTVTPELNVAVNQKSNKKNTKKEPEVAVQPDDSSILLSDDESPPTPVQRQPVAKPAIEPTPAKSVIPLDPSLLTNQNFIKIVAHTYLSGNPMLDEDAATLAAQYSTLKLFKESESTGKPIESGPIYDIAVKVLGEQVLAKLHQQSKNKDGGSNAASSKMMQFLRQDPPGPKTEPAPTPVKKKPGPKSRVKPVKEEPQDIATKTTSTTTQKKAFGVVPVDQLRRSLNSAPTPTAEHANDECILPDDEDDVRCVTEPNPPPPVIKVKTLTPLKKEQELKLKTEPPLGRGMPLRVTTATSSGAPPKAPKQPPAKTYTTISLDSDDDEPTSGIPQYPPSAGPVPVALTGPDSQPIPLAVNRPAPAQLTPQPEPSQPTFYTYQPAVRYPPEPVPVSLTGPDTGPVPVSLTGPDNRPVPISLTGPGFHSVPISMGAGQPSTHTATPVSFVGPDGVQRSFAGMTQPMTSYTSVNAGGIQPASTFTPLQATAPGAPRALRLTLAPGQGSGLQQMGNNVYLVPTSKPPQTTKPLVPLPQQPKITKTYCKPGDLLRLTPSGQLEVIKSGSDVVHTIEDDEPQAITTPTTMVRTNKRLNLQPVSTPPPKVVTTQPSKVTTQPSKVTTQPSKVTTQPSKVTTQPSKVTTQPSKVTTQPSKVTTQPSKVTTKSSKVTTSLPKTQSPAAVPKPATPVATEETINDRRKRKVSSSSCSNSSRSPSPDPLSIFRDVVHIQAPERKSKLNKPTAEKPTPKPPTTSNPVKQYGNQKNPSSVPTTVKASSYKDEINKINKKLNDILGKDLKSATPSKTTPGKATANSKAAVAKIKDSIDLTEISFQPAKVGESSKNMKTVSSATKKDGPSTIVGTSKNIVLDGKSKSLTNKQMVDLTGQKSVQVTKVKTLPSTSAANKPPEKKRPAAPPEPPAAKKKKTEPLTLKDFDIDDIDDIIELD